MKCVFREAGEAQKRKAGEDDRIYNVVAFCHENLVSEYNFDKRHALVLATGVVLVQESPEVYEIVAEPIAIVMSDDLERTREALQRRTAIAVYPSDPP